MAFEWLNEDSRKFLSHSYVLPGQTVESRIMDIAKAAEKFLNYPGFADKFYDYMGKGYYSLSSPVWANFGNDRGLPISCNGVLVEDDMGSIFGKLGEVGIQTKHGAGTSGYFGKLRPRGAPIKDNGHSDGPVQFLNLFETTTNVVSQGSVRRGAFAAYLNIDHPDIEEFLNIREVGHSIQNMSLGVTIPDWWMEEMIEEENLVKEKKLLTKNAQKLNLWAKILRKRKESGYPYLFFSDTVNDNKPQVLKDKNIPIWASNLCSEICLPSSEEWSFVCNLSSLNLVKWDEWKDTDAVEVLTYFLDAVMSEYIKKTRDIPHMGPAYKFAKTWRALGIGQLGWHSFLQTKNIAFESFEAISYATRISKFIDEKSLEASKEMAIRYGEPEGLTGYGVRNLTRCAIAPTTSSSFALGQVSPSVEPLPSNYFNKVLAKGNYTWKNPILATVLEKYNQNTEETWDDIRDHRGSVQHLDYLSEHEKNVFKTFEEIVPLVIIQQAAARQKYIDQAQSLNLMIPHDAPIKDVNSLIKEAWKLKVKTLYYQRSSNPSQELVRNILNCVACEA